MIHAIWLLARATLLLGVALGLIAVLSTWFPQSHPTYVAANYPPAAAQDADPPSERTDQQGARSYLDEPERPDVLNEPLPPMAEPSGIFHRAAPRRITALPPPALTAASWVIVDEGSGQVLFGQHVHRRHAPASTTKIMTALLAVERGKLDQTVLVDVLGATIPDSTLVYLVPGDVLTMRDLLYGLLLHSGNDAAVQIAHTVAGREATFVALMNERARQLGLNDTHFANPHGLDENGLFSSPYDLATLARYAMGYADFSTIVKAKDWRVTGPPNYGMFNGNRLLSEYEGADGVKIGDTDLAGQTIVASATRNGHRVYAVVLGSRDRTADTKRLLDFTFANYGW